jgi:O-succinylbenzoate synthase
MEAVVLDHALALTSSSGVRLGYARLGQRAGRVLALRCDGVLGLGEASPAWWAGDESLEASRAALARAAVWLRRPATDPAALEDAARSGTPYPRGLEAALSGSPTARSAVQCAIADLRARAAGLTLAEALGGRNTACTTNALIADEDATGVARSIRRALADGYRTVKLKVGASGRAEDGGRIAAALDGAAGRLRLRLDANRAWTLEQAVALLEGLRDAPIEYVEEPLRDAEPAALYRLRERTGVAIALDESLASRADLERFAGAYDVAVLKAPRLGGPHATMRMIAAARELGAAVTITDALESCIGRALALHLAAAAGLEERAVGLAGASLLAEDLSSERALLRGPIIEPSGPGLLDVAALDRLALDAAFASGHQQ